jgi:hypothetical protein
MLRDQGIFDYRPERLALTGYRCSMAAYDHGDAACWDELWSSYVEDGGLDFACAIMGRLQHFVRSLRPALAGCHYYPRNCRRLCVQEGLVLGLLAAQQHGKLAEARCAVLGLLHGSMLDQEPAVLLAAQQYANGLSEAQMLLLPVPLTVIQSLKEKSQCANSCPLKLH